MSSTNGVAGRIPIRGVAEHGCCSFVSTAGHGVLIIGGSCGSWPAIPRVYVLHWAERHGTCCRGNGPPCGWLIGWPNPCVACDGSQCPYPPRRGVRLTFFSQAFAAAESRAAFQPAYQCGGNRLMGASGYRTLYHADRAWPYHLCATLCVALTGRGHVTWSKVVGRKSGAGGVRWA